MSYEILDALMSEPEDWSGVYFIRAVGTGLVKVGCAVSIMSRLKTLQTGCPYEMKLERIIETSDKKRLEKQLHQQLRDKRVRGEWFRLTSREVSDVFKAPPRPPMRVAKVKDFEKSTQDTLENLPYPGFSCDDFGYDKFGIHWPRFAKGV